MGSVITQDRVWTNHMTGILIRREETQRGDTQKPWDNRGRDCSHACTSHGTLRDPRRRQKLEEARESPPW